MKKKDVYHQPLIYITFALLFALCSYFVPQGIPVEAVLEDAQQPLEATLTKTLPKAAYTLSVRPLGFSWPLPNHKAGRGYGWTRSAFDRSKTVFHNGVDIVAKEGTPIFSGEKGKVYRARYMGACGKGVIIIHVVRGFRRVSTTYCHLTRFDVEEGQEVERFEKIGEVGSTGASTTPHLHLAVYVNRKHTEPTKHFENRP
jgi:murein DD-endopeptidase MepM/ murein hydrolase activator NlpD